MRTIAISRVPSGRLLARNALLTLALACAKDTKPAASVDTVSDSAATATARALSRAPAGTAVSMTVTGTVSFDGPLDARATCSYGSDNDVPTTRVEAFARDAQVAFEIIKPAVGRIPVKSGAVGAHAGPRVSSLQFVVHSHTYGDGRGTATLTDPVGRAGSLSAAHFSRIGIGKRHGSDLAITVHWECE
ncbi:MAG: hypothetical protein JJD97_07310 [Gemmatimonadaceae bacterium]|nr:hypothetical protein [Gemmatimonadaceae bacterium]